MITSLTRAVNGTSRNVCKGLSDTVKFSEVPLKVLDYTGHGYCDVRQDLEED